jgi:hypothetical protein
VAYSLSRSRILQTLGGRRCFWIYDFSSHIFELQLFLDLWALPDARLTSTLTTEVEENFYARCPPELRPDLRSPKKEQAGSESITPSISGEDKEKQEGGVKASKTKWWSRFQMKPKMFKTDSAGNKIYDSSLLKALHRTFFIRWWTGGILLLLAGGFNSAIFTYKKLILFLPSSLTQTRFKPQPRLSTKSS